MPSMIGIAIKQLREEQGMSQNQLAKRSGISQSAISSIESTTKSPSIDTVFEIAAALNTTVPQLLGFTSEAKEKPTVMDDGQRVNILVDLSPEELQRVVDFVAGIKAARPKDASRQG